MIPRRGLPSAVVEFQGINRQFPASFSLFRLFNTADNQQILIINFCRCLDSISGPLVSEATALPTVPQPQTNH